MVGARVVDGLAVTVVTGMLTLAAGLTLLALLADADRGYLSILPGLLLIGAGVGLAMSPSTTAITSSLTEDKQGVASALNDTVREIGAAMGLALPPKRITINLSPADLPKEGSHYDLPIALGMMCAIGALPAQIGNAGKVVKTETWGLRSLAYRIAKNRKAHYVMLEIDAPGDVVAELERQTNINEDVIRYMTIRTDALEEGPSVMMRKSDRSERGDRRDRGDRGDRGPRRDRDGGDQ